MTPTSPGRGLALLMGLSKALKDGCKKTKSDLLLCHGNYLLPSPPLTKQLDAGRRDGAGQGVGHEGGPVH